MEEIITLDGKQFKLTTDRPLTALERQQTIEQIRKQTGCSGCGSKVMSGGTIYNMAPSCAGGTKGTGDTITLNAAPMFGTGPYIVKFYMKRNTEAPFLITTGSGTPAIGTPGGGAATQTAVAEATTATVPTATALTYTLLDSDIAYASGDTTASVPTSDTTGAVVNTTTSSASLDVGKIRFITTITDSCPTLPKFCAEYCDVTVACPTPTCNFIVT